MVLCSHPPSLEHLCGAPSAAAAVATAQTYRALSVSGTPDVVILLYSKRSGVASQLDAAPSWTTPLGVVESDATVGAALRAGGVESPLAASAPVDHPIALWHSPWLWFLAAQYDCERRENLVIPQLVAVVSAQAIYYVGSPF